MTVVELRFPSDRPTWIACFSDLHLDGPDHDREALIRDLEYAKKRGARILVGGDVFTAIFPKDKRYSVQHGKGRGHDALIDEAVKGGFKVLRPYADYIDMIGEGNHDVVPLKEHYTDMVNSLRLKLQEVRKASLPRIRHGGYCGFIIMRFHTGSRRVSDTWYWHHGAGGNAPVTRGMIDMNRLIASNRASVYWIGHKHTNVSDIPRVRELDRAGNYQTTNIIQMVTAGYGGRDEAEEYEEDGYVHDWGQEKFYGPESQGCALIQYKPRVKHRSEIVLDRFVTRPVHAT